MAVLLNKFIILLSLACLEMVQNALIHLHKKKASGEPLGQLPLPVPADRPVVRTIGESQGAPTLRENRHSGIAAQTELTAEGKISTKGTAPILLPHPGEQGKRYSRRCRKLL